MRKTFRGQFHSLDTEFLLQKNSFVIPDENLRFQALDFLSNKYLKIYCILTEMYPCAPWVVKIRMEAGLQKT